MMVSSMTDDIPEDAAIVEVSEKMHIVYSAV